MINEENMVGGSEPVQGTRTGTVLSLAGGGSATGERPALQRGRATGRKVLVVDVGGTHVKVLVTGQTVSRHVISGKHMTPKRMVSDVQKMAADCDYDFVSIGYPGPVLNNQPVLDPWNLGKGWVHFDFKKAFKCPVKIINDAAMQALGSYRRGKMLFLGLGTGLGSAMIVSADCAAARRPYQASPTGFVVVPMELAHLPYRKRTFEDYVGIRGQVKYGKKKWRGFVEDVTARLVAALEPDEVVLGGGNVHQLKKLPPLCRAGENENAFGGGFRLWESESDGNAKGGDISSVRRKHEIIIEHKKRVTQRAE
jgi:polyphosphate glucokinase